MDPELFCDAMGLGWLTWLTGKQLEERNKENMIK
jgi:hypothetical protein